MTAGEKVPTPLICDECGKQLEPFKRAHECDGGIALRKAAHELFAPTVDLIERTIAKAGTGVLRGVFEVAAERDRLRTDYDALQQRAAGLEAREKGLSIALNHITELNAEDPGDCLVAIKIARAALAAGGSK